MNPRPTAWEADALPLSYTRTRTILDRGCAAGPIVYLGRMLDEVLSPQERDVVARARAFAEQHVAPHAAHWEWERRYPLEAIQAGVNWTWETYRLRGQHRG